MSIELTKSQKQDLGMALTNAGYSPSKEFVYSEEQGGETPPDSATLTHRDSPNSFTIRRSSSRYDIVRTIPGTSRSEGYDSLSWSDVTGTLRTWAIAVKRESEAVDPWQQEAEDMANDDSLFTVSELPRVDKAIEESLEELRELAVKQGIASARIESELRETKKLLKKSARSSTKKEWLSIFKGIILEKLLDWGMEQVVFQTILQTLITSAHDITQLVQHASHHLLN